MKEKDLNLCGLGNGLVDLQFEISEAELYRLGLAKGNMRLVSAEEQEKLLKSLEGKKHFKCSGGSAANTIIAFSNFGGKAAYKTALGKDDNGKFYAREFRDLGIELKASFNNYLPTGTCVVLITPDSERTMNTCLAATSQYRPDEIDEELIARSEWLYIEGYKFSEKSGTDAIKLALRHALKYNTKVAVTFSDLFITENFHSQLESVVKNACLVFCNESEAISYTKKPAAEEAFIELSNLCPSVVMTMGGKGSKINWKGMLYDIKPFPVKALDSTGAGDMFAGAFLYGLLYWHDLQKAGELASYSASRVITQYGARLTEDFKKLRDFVINL